MMTSEVLDRLFLDARSFGAWIPKDLDEDTPRRLYDLARQGPTSFNTNPARFVFCRSVDARARLAACAVEKNRPRILTAPLTVIIGYDTAFYEKLEQLQPGSAHMQQRFRDNADMASQTAFRNSSLQGAYLMIAARALGLDCGPMSGFDHDAVDNAFFDGTGVRSNFLCSIGHGDRDSLKPLSPRLDFDEACRLI